MKPKNSLSVIFSVFVVILFSFACNKENEIRSYKEKIEKKDIPSGFHGNDTIESTAPESNIKWNTPDGWSPAKNSSKLRIATYLFKSENREAICTLIPLSGDGGGIIANVQMWLSSLQKEEIKETEIKEFISRQKKFKTFDNHEGIFLDFIE